MKEVLLSCLSHHEAHSSNPSVCFLVFILSRIWLVNHDVLHDVLRIRGLTSEHSALIHAVWDQGDVLVGILGGGMRLHTLVSLVL